MIECKSICEKLSLDVPDQLSAVDFAHYTGKSQTKLKELIECIDQTLLHQQIFSFDSKHQIFLKVDGNNILNIYAYYQNGSQCTITQNALRDDGSVELVESFDVVASKQAVADELVDISNTHLLFINHMCNCNLLENSHFEVNEYSKEDEEQSTMVIESQSPAEAIKKLYSSGENIRTTADQSDLSFQYDDSSDIPPTRLKERFASRDDESSVRTYTEDQINAGEAKHQYGDSNMHEIRVSNTISQLDVRSKEAATIDNQIIEFNSGSKITEIAPSCFMNAQSLEKVVLQDHTITFGDSAFKNCTSLTSINIESLQLQNVGNNCFSNTKLIDPKITLFTSPGGTIGDSIFSECHSLKSAEIHTNHLLTYIFNNCENLTSLTVVLSNINNDFVQVDDETIYSIGQLKECTICGDVSEFPVMDQLCSLTMVNLSSTLDNAKIQNYNFSVTPKLTSLTLGDFIHSYSQISISALGKSSVKVLKLLGLSYQDLLDSLDDEIYSEDDEYFKPLKYTYNPQQATVTQHTTGTYKRHDNTYPYPLRARSTEDKTQIFYYGKIYSQLDKAIEFSVQNKIPILLINQATQIDSTSNNIFTRKLFYEWLAQQPLITVLVNCRIGTQNCHAYTEMASVSLITGIDLKMEKTSGHQYKYPFAEDNLTYTTQTELYSAKTKYIWDQGSAIYNYNSQYCSNISSVYKFYKTNDIWNKKRIVYDIKNDKVGDVIELTSNVDVQRYVTGEDGKKQSGWLKLIGNCSHIELLEDGRTIYNEDLSHQCAQIDWPVLNNSLLFIPDSNVLVSTSAYATNPYLINKPLFISTYKDIKIFSLFNGHTYILPLVGTYQNRGNLGSSANPYKLIWDGVDYETYLDSVAKKNDEGQLLSYQLQSAEYKEAYDKHQKFINDNIAYSCHFDKGVKNVMKMLDLNFKHLLKDYVRDPRFNAPDYVKKDIDLEYIKTEKVPFNCWGIEHDCEIWTSDHIKAKWDYKNQKLSKIGKW